MSNYTRGLQERRPNSIATLKSPQLCGNANPLLHQYAIAKITTPT